jgi:hypothetical protein
MMIAENIPCLRAHRNNMHRYQRLLAMQHSDIRRSCRRLRDEQAAAEAILQIAFPVSLRMAKTLGQEANYVST